MPTMIAQDVEREICAVLRGECVQPIDEQSFAQMAVDEGVGPLILQSLDRSTLGELQEEMRRQLALAAVREGELRRLLAALADAGADVLLIKGAHLAYTVYSDPALRPRNDTDVLVRPGHERAASHALERLGYERQPAITGAAVQGQTIFEHPAVPGTVLDVHWRLAAPIVAADLFDFSQLWRRADCLPQLGPAARAPHRLDAIAIAAVHLVAHHPNELGLLWLHDLHLLVSALDDADVDAMIAEARSRRISTIVATALRRAEARFPSPQGTAILDAIEEDDSEPSAALLDPRTPSETALMDLRALAGWRARTSYLAGHLFPPSDYMRRRYAPNSRAPLSWLYATRILSGARKWLAG
jgi:hypothetical protein